MIELLDWTTKAYEFVIFAVFTVFIIVVFGLGQLIRTKGQSSRQAKKIARLEGELDAARNQVETLSRSPKDAE